MAERVIERGGVRLAAEEAGEGPGVILLHGLTATRRYVVMGSSALARSGHRVIAYDARGHGRSSPAAASGDYGYEDLGRDLEAVLDDAGIERAVLAGASMGAHTLLWLALRRPERVGGLVVITPAYEPQEGADEAERLARWDALSEGLRTGGVEGFLAAYGEPEVPERWRETVLKVMRQRLSAHEHPEAVADALHVVPRSRPFEALEQLGSIAVPTIVVASDDAADPGHPRAVGEAYAAAIPNARLVTDEPGRSPIAWQGSQLSQLIAEVVDAAQLGMSATGAGYSGTPLVRKLGIKPGARVALIGAPDGFDAVLGVLPDAVTVVGRLRGPCDVIVAFFTERGALERRLPALRAALSPAGGLWIAWPKRASGVPTDIGEGAIRALGLQIGLVDNKVCAIDETWSGLRFVYRLADRAAVRPPAG